MKTDFVPKEEVNKFLIDFINWENRRKGENNFFVNLLNRYKCKYIFNSALGDGYDTVNLIKAGFKVTSNEIDSIFIKEAKQNAKKQDLELKLTDYDWRAIPNKLNNSFDALICLGNSLTYIMTRKDQFTVLKNFRKILKPQGIAIIDTRNYDYMLDERRHILKDPINNFRYSGKYYYGGGTIKGYPIVIEEKRVILEYLNMKTSKKVHLELYPFRRRELIDLMNRSGLRVIETYGDFKLNKIKEADFYQFVGRKE